MRDMFRAEWLKIAGNRWVAGCLVWIFPIGAAVLVVVAALIFASKQRMSATTGIFP
jgi:hypothetical protein